MHSKVYNAAPQVLAQSCSGSCAWHAPMPCGWSLGLGGSMGWMQTWAACMLANAKLRPALWAGAAWARVQAWHGRWLGPGHAAWRLGGWGKQGQPAVGKPEQQAVQAEVHRWGGCLGPGVLPADVAGAAGLPTSAALVVGSASDSWPGRPSPEQASPGPPRPVLALQASSSAGPLGPWDPALLSGVSTQQRGWAAGSPEPPGAHPGHPPERGAVV